MAIGHPDVSVFNFPSFDGHLDPHTYINWQLVMNCYFCWHGMSESRKIQFVMMKLREQAVQY